ncbi:MAG: hypothetical protein AB1403_18060 [Candidatus Riflebacteria bacterium]
MKFRWVFLILFLIAVITGFAGCSSSEEGSFGSAWTTLPAKNEVADPVDVASTTSTPEISVKVTPAQATVLNDNSVPVSVTLVGSNTSEMTVQVAMSSSLGGTFNPDKGNFENGSFLTSFTAPSNLTGTAELVALAGSVIGTSAIQILPKTQVTYQLQVTPSSLALGQLQTTPLTVRVTDSNGVSVNDSEITLTTSLEGTFGSNTGKTQDGIFTTTFTSGNVAGNCTITAVSQGVSGSAVVVISVMPSISIVPVFNPVANGQTQTLSVKITDERGNPLKGIKAYIYSSSGGAFNNASDQTDDLGYVYFDYTAPAPAPLTGNDTITVQALGKTQALTIAIQ